jgi:tight adherence protein C
MEMKVEITEWMSATGGAQAYALGSSLLLALSLTTCVVALSKIPALLPVEGGTRGKQRKRAMKAPLFSALEPTLRRMGGVMRMLLSHVRLRGPMLRRWTDAFEDFHRRQLIWAGEPLGLDRYELMGISLCSAVVGGCLAGVYGEGSLVWVFPASVIASALPSFRLQSMASDRFVEAAHELPAAIDLMALAMSAGADLPGALRRVTEGKGVVAEELGYLLHCLDLGITRSAALVALRDRLPVQEVRDFVRAILMAEKKGTSIADALVQQARAGRQRRSVRAEESAARAGVLLLLPLMLLMACVLIMMIGPLLSSEMGF